MSAPCKHGVIYPCDCDCHTGRFAMMHMVACCHPCKQCEIESAMPPAEVVLFGGGNSTGERGMQADEESMAWMLRAWAASVALDDIVCRLTVGEDEGFSEEDFEPYAKRINGQRARLREECEKLGMNLEESPELRWFDARYGRRTMEEYKAHIAAGGSPVIMLPRAPMSAKVRRMSKRRQKKLFKTQK